MRCATRSIPRVSARRRCDAAARSGTLRAGACLQIALLENHLRFLALHRSEVHRTDWGWRIESPSPAFRFWWMEQPPSRVGLPTEVRAVRTVPWAPEVAPELEALGFEAKETLRYMRLAATPEPPAVPGLSIAIARDANGIRDFTDVQTRGFLEPDERYEAWFAFLLAPNLRNLTDADQRFYLGAVEGVPAAVTLCLIASGVAGIYAVATLPAFRRRGLSRALLARAIADARLRRIETVALQTYAGSDAERLYRALGFVPEFDSVIYERATPA